MIKIENKILKTQENFWNHCLFHPTDAVEDPWGRRILDRIARDKAITGVRIYAMLEDIVYIDEDGEIAYDFRISDLRLDYLIDRGFDLLLAYAGIPDCIATSTQNKTSVSKNKTRYKGKMWNSAPPKDFAVWEEICYEYTKHLVERYGIEKVSTFRMQCFNEADIPHFFLSEYPNDAESAAKYRLPLYCKLYEGFERGIRRVSDRIRIGGPALAGHHNFLGGFLDFVKEKNLKLDFVSVHNYGTSPAMLNDGSMPYTVQNNIRRHTEYAQTVAAHGFAHLPLLVDEWGMACSGFYNKEECPALIARETEVFSAYFTKLIHAFTYSDFKIDMLSLCLSGQHEMTEDFSGFRNFFTLNFIAKPIYNSYILAHKLGTQLLASTHGENRFVLPTKTESGYAVMLCYSSENFEEDIPEVDEVIAFEESIVGKHVRIFCIDKNTTNPYRLWERMGEPEICGDVLLALKEEGKIKPTAAFTADKNEISLHLSPNATFLVTVE
jgi:xylan 1,4-beta-xylosidase